MKGMYSWIELLVFDDRAKKNGFQRKWMGVWTGILTHGNQATVIEVGLNDPPVIKDGNWHFLHLVKFSDVPIYKANLCRFSSLSCLICLICIIPKPTKWHLNDNVFSIKYLLNKMGRWSSLTILFGLILQTLEHSSTIQGDVCNTPSSAIKNCLIAGNHPLSPMIESI